MSDTNNKISEDGHFNILNNMYSLEKIFINNLILGLQTQILNYTLNKDELNFILKKQKDINLTQINEYPFSVLEAHLNACIANEFLDTIKKNPSFSFRMQSGGAEGGHIGAILFHDKK